MKFTGERFHPEVTEYWNIEHLHRYHCISDFVINKTVVDIACGEGYGSNILSNYANTVIGIDISYDAIAHANNKYVKPNLLFKIGNGIDIPVESNSIDVIVSFETIEHFTEHDEFILEIKRILKPNGIVIISTPDKHNYSEIPNYNNSFHIKELYKEEFQKLLSDNFFYTKVFNQCFILGSVIIEPGEMINNKFYEFKADQVNIYNRLNNPIYHIIIASNTSIPLGTLSSFFHYKNYYDIQKYDIAYIKFNTLEYKIGRLITIPFRRFIKYRNKLRLFLKIIK